MAVVEGDFWSWAGRLRQAGEDVNREVRWLRSEMSGPFSAVVKMAASDMWEGPFAEQLRGTIRSFDRQLVPWVEHLGQFRRALEDVARDAEIAARAGTAGIVAPFDPDGALARWRVWPAPSWPLAADWAAPGGRPTTFVSVYPERARQLAVGLRQVAEQLRAARSRLANALAPISFDAPPCFEPLAGGAETVAAEVDRRLAALEEADRRAAGAFAALGAALGLPGTLAPPPHTNPTDPLGSALPAAPPADKSAGRQASQATETDPVSVPTGNYRHEAVDLAMGGRGLPTMFVRSYNSLRADVDGPLGFGWATNLSAHLRIEDDVIVVCSGDGREESHHRAPSGVRTASATSSGRLEAGQGGFALHHDDGTVSRFGGSGQLVGFADLSGNRTLLQYVEGRLSRVLDPAGRETRFEHDRAGRITAMMDCLGGRFAYRYDRDGNLVGSPTPSAGGGPTATTTPTASRGSPIRRAAPSSRTITTALAE